MATLELCDLCGGKVKTSPGSISLRGQVMLFKGPVPPPPAGFKYAEDYDKNSHGKISYQKVWDHFGNVVKEIRMIEDRETRWNNPFFKMLGYDVEDGDDD